MVIGRHFHICRKFKKRTNFYKSRLSIRNYKTISRQRSNSLESLSGTDLTTMTTETEEIRVGKKGVGQLDDLISLFKPKNIKIKDKKQPKEIQEIEIDEPINKKK